MLAKMGPSATPTTVTAVKTQTTLHMPRKKNRVTPESPTSITMTDVHAAGECPCPGSEPFVIALLEVVDSQSIGP
jgi:hypothetical protein